MNPVTQWSCVVIHNFQVRTVEVCIHLVFTLQGFYQKQRAEADQTHCFWIFSNALPIKVRIQMLGSKNRYCYDMCPKDG